MCLADNVFVEGVGGVLVRKPGLQDTFKVRTLSDGTSHEILKNYYVEAELREMLVPFATDVRITMGNCFWRVEYRTARKS